MTSVFRPFSVEMSCDTFASLSPSFSHRGAIKLNETSRDPLHHIYLDFLDFLAFLAFLAFFAIRITSFLSGKCTESPAAVKAILKKFSKFS